MTNFQPREITFDQIRKGDTLLITQVNGRVETTKRANAITKYGTGVGEQWVNEDDVNVISYSQTTPSTPSVITLLNRELPADLVFNDVDTRLTVSVATGGNLELDLVGPGSRALSILLNNAETIKLLDYLTTVLEG